MKLRARSNGEIIEASLDVPEGEAPRVCVGALTLSLGAALITYDVVEATAAERRTLERLGHPFGGAQ